MVNKGETDPLGAVGPEMDPDAFFKADAPFEGISPKALFDQFNKISRDESQAKKGYEDFCRACFQVISTQAGATMMEQVKRITGYYNPSFSDADGFNTHAAAVRDGSRQLINELEFAARIGGKL